MPVPKSFAAAAFFVCAVAAFRLRTTPLWGTAAAVAGTNALAWLLAMIATRGGRPASRPLTALQHVTAALGGFFLFVSFALP